jgi:hypothetical protein
MTRITAKLFAVTVGLTAFLHGAPTIAAGPVAWISSTSNDSNPGCTAAQPCQSFFTASTALSAAGGQISCLDSPGPSEAEYNGVGSLTTDCAGVYEVTTPNQGAFILGTNQVLIIRNLTISGAGGGYPAIKVVGDGSGTVILENCVFEKMAGTALDIEPGLPLNFVIKNSRISNSASGMLLKPAAGGSIKATFDHVTITNNTGGGIKTDSPSAAARIAVPGTDADV